MSHPFYHTTRWRARRARQLAEHPLCAMCEKQGKVTAASIADHVEPHRGDPVAFWTGKLQSLCKRCHDSAKQLKEKHGVYPGCDVDGMPLDPDHVWSKGE